MGGKILGVSMILIDILNPEAVIIGSIFERSGDLMIDSVIGDNFISETLRNDCLKLLKGFLHVIDNDDPIILDAMWIGLYHTLIKANNCLREIKELQLLLEKFGVIK